MKKRIILILSVLLTVPSAAQIHTRHGHGRYQHANSHYMDYNRYQRDGYDHYFGLRLGLNLSTINSGDVDLDTDLLAGLNLGAVAGLQLSYRAPVWLELGLCYSEKGGTTTIDGHTVKYRLGYMEMPITLKYGIDVSNFRILPFLGGYLATGIAGKTKYNQTRTSHASWDRFKRFDGGIRLGCGAECQMIYLEAGFDFGLANINKDDFDTARNMCFFINAGVNF